MAAPTDILHVEEWLACPNCRRSLMYIKEMEGPGVRGVTHCEACCCYFPVDDGIFVLFREEVRNPQFEIPIFKRLCRHNFDPEVWSGIERQTARLGGRDFRRTWEWDDVEFWERQYLEMWEKMDDGISVSDHTWPERILQREDHVRLLCQEEFLVEGSIVEIGCGTANYFTKVLNAYPVCPYIAIDMSFHALKVRRRRLNRTQAIYIVGSIDNLPLRPNRAGLLIVAGILHHSERKADLVPDLKSLLAPGGVIYLDEVLSRPSFLKHKTLIKGVNVSAHEESVDGGSLLRQFSSDGVIEYMELFNTPFYTFSTTYLKWILVSTRSIYRLFRIIDSMLMKSVGHILESFRPGEGTFIWRKDTHRMA